MTTFMLSTEVALGSSDDPARVPRGTRRTRSCLTSWVRSSGRSGTIHESACEIAPRLTSTVHIFDLICPHATPRRLVTRSAGGPGTAGGQGRDRTADLPLFSSPVIRSGKAVSVERLA